MVVGGAVVANAVPRKIIIQLPLPDLWKSRPADPTGRKDDVDGGLELQVQSSGLTAAVQESGGKAPRYCCAADDEPSR